MKKQNHTWLWIATVLQFMIAAIHSISFFVQGSPANETEAQLTKLMSTYKMDLGGGFTPTMDNLFLSMSVCFTLLGLLAALINTYLLKKRAQINILQGIAAIETFIFGIAFAVMLTHTFLLPIISTGIIFLTLLITTFILRKKQAMVVG